MKFRVMAQLTPMILWPSKQHDEKSMERYPFVFFLNNSFDSLDIIVSFIKIFLITQDFGKSIFFDVIFFFPVFVWFQVSFRLNTQREKKICVLYIHCQDFFNECNLCLFILSIERL